MNKRKKKPSPRDKRVTVTDVARSLGLSNTTVSMVLNHRAEEYGIAPATVKRVQDEARKMNFHPSAAARQLVGKRSDAVGVLINSEAIADPRLIQRMEILAAERGLRFIVGHAVGTSEKVKSYLDDFRARGVDGIISIFHGHPDYADTVLPELARFDNVVYFEKPETASVRAAADACYVQPNYYEIGRAGVQHLLDRGRRRIATVLSDLVFPYAQARLHAYQDTLTAAGLRKNKNLVWVMDRQPGMHWSSPFSEELAAKAVEAVVTRGKADAIVAVQDFYAARLISALQRSGRRVPDDVAVVGCDNQDIGTVVTPRLTTFEMHVDQAAAAMVALLFELLDRGKVPKERRAVIVEPTLVVRESS
jgi:DNA-binding LacI/PurR family transcriptional regulator